MFSARGKLASHVRRRHFRRFRLAEHKVLALEYWTCGVCGEGEGTIPNHWPHISRHMKKECAVTRAKAAEKAVKTGLVWPC